MKKVWISCIVVMMLCTTTAATVLASSVETITGKFESDVKIQVENSLIQHLNACDTAFSFKLLDDYRYSFSTNYALLEECMYKNCSDWVANTIGWYQSSQDFTYDKKSNVTVHTVDFSVSWFDNTADLQYSLDYVHKNLPQILKNCKTEYEKVKAINTFICDNFSYDYTYTIHSVHNMILTKQGVCQAYSSLAYLFLKEAGLECRIISKDSYAGDEAKEKDWGRHAWNLVKVDGQWYHLDTTWCDGSSGYTAYFLMSDASISKTHKWDKQQYPAAAKSDYVSTNAENPNGYMYCHQDLSLFRRFYVRFGFSGFIKSN